MVYTYIVIKTTPINFYCNDAKKQNIYNLFNLNFLFTSSLLVLLDGCVYVVYTSVHINMHFR